MDGFYVTYIIYNSLFIPFLIFFLLKRYVPYIVNISMFIISSFFLLLMVSGFRYNVGADYENYVWIFHNLEEYQLGYGVEWGFYFLNKIIYLVGFDEQIVFFLMSLFTIAYVYLFAYNTKRIILVVLLFLLVFYFYSFTQIRQVLAMMICLYAINEYIKKRNLLIFCMNIGIASLFHTSSLISFIVIFFGFFSYNRLILIFVLIISVIFVFIDIRPYLLEFGVLSFSKFQSYLYSEHYNELSTSLGAMIRSFFKIFIVFPILFLNKEYFKGDLFRYNIVLYMNSVLLIVLAMSFNFYILHRVVLFFYMSVMLSTILLMDSKYKYKLQFICFYIFLNFIVYEYFVFIETFYDDAPYKTILDRLN